MTKIKTEYRVPLRIVTLVIVLSFLTGISTDICYGSEPKNNKLFDDMGSDISYFKTIPGVVESATHIHSVIRTAHRLGKFVSPSVKLGVEIHSSFHKSKPKNSLVGKNNALEMGFNLASRYYWATGECNTRPYVGIVAGLSWLRDNHSQPDFADSGLLGTWGGITGADIFLTNFWSLRIEYRLTHTSDPLNHGDRGRNYRGFVTGLTYNF